MAHWQDRGKFWERNNFLPLEENNKNSSGFSATLFQNKETKDYTLAFKGTAGGKDLIWVDAGNIVLDGIAHDQLIDLYNFWIQINTEKDKVYEADYYRKIGLKDFEFYSDKNIDLDGKYYVVDFKPSNELYAEDSGYTHGLGILNFWR